MSFLQRTTLHSIANIFALLIAQRLITGFVFLGDSMDLIITGIVLALVNLLIKPFLKFLTFPIIILTLGLFSILINIILLYLVSGITATMQIDGFWSAFWTVIIISLINNAIFSIAKEKNKQAHAENN